MSERAHFLRAVERYGDRSIPSRSMGSTPEQRSGVMFEGTRLELVLELEQAQDVATYRLFIDAAVPGAYDLTLELGSGMMWTLRNLVRRVRLGDAAFDSAAVLRANDAELARLWLSQPVREAFLDSLGLKTRIDRGLLRTWVPRDVNYSDVEAGLRTSARLVGRAGVIGEAMRNLAGQLDAIAHDGDWRPDEVLLTVQKSGVNVELEHVLGLPGESWRARGLRTRLRAGRAHPGSGRLAAYHVDTRRARQPNRDGMERVELGVPRGWIVFADNPTFASPLEEASTLLERVRPASITIDDSMVTVLTPGASLEPEHVHDAVDLTARLAVGVRMTAGPYR